MSTAGIAGDAEPARRLVHHLYHRYLKEGAYVPWARRFGKDCPEPDFESAARLPRILFIRHTRHFFSVHRWPVLFAGILFLIGAAGLFFRWRPRTA